MANSTHKVEVFRIQQLEKHPNADTLSILRVFDNYQVVVRTDDVQVGDLACYVPPDNVLPDLPEYEFLKRYKENGEEKLNPKKLRIKAAKFRGIVSQGLVLKAPEGSKEGDDVAERLGVTHYVPDDTEGLQGGTFVADPAIPGYKYDIDSWFRYGSVLPDGTPVEITEKLHGSCTRASFQDGKFWMGSKEAYRQQENKCLYWRVLNENLWLKDLCEQNPECVVYGEVFGKVQTLKYGAKGNQIFFRVFDILTPTGYMNHAAKVAAMVNVVTYPNGTWKDFHVPIIYIGPYSPKLVTDLMSGPSTIPGTLHEREGVVIKPLIETWNQEIGRLVLKAVSPAHLEKDKS